MEQDYSKSQTTRDQQPSRITAVFYAILTVTSLLFFVYAFIQKTHAERTVMMADSLRVELEYCIRENKQLHATAENAMQAATQQRLIAEKAVARAIRMEELKTDNH